MSRLPLLLALLASPVAAAPPSWIVDDFPRALSEARTRQQKLVVDVMADWCEPCHQLSADVLDTDAATPVLQGVVAAKVDFDSQRGQDVVRRYGVLGLPTTLVLSSSGDELGRIEGFEKRDEYVEALKALLAGGDDLASTRAAWEKQKTNVDRTLAYATRLLGRGESARAKELLAPFLAKDDGDGAKASRLLGRWLLRVQGDAAAAEAHFRAASQRYAKTASARGLRYWHAKALAKLGRIDEGVAVFTATQTPEAASDLADFLVGEKQSPTRCMTAIVDALKRTPQTATADHAWLRYLAAETARRNRDYVSAKREIKKAIALDPKRAIFTHLSERLDREWAKP